MTIWNKWINKRKDVNKPEVAGLIDRCEAERNVYTCTHVKNTAAIQLRTRTSGGGTRLLIRIFCHSFYAWIIFLLFSIIKTVFFSLIFYIEGFLQVLTYLQSIKSTLRCKGFFASNKYINLFLYEVDTILQNTI